MLLFTWGLVSRSRAARYAKLRAITSCKNSLTYQPSKRPFAAIFRGLHTRAKVEENEEWLSSLLAEEHTKVNVASYISVLQAIAKSDLPDKALRAEQWLKHLEIMSRKGENSICATKKCYRLVIEAWASALSEDSAIAVIRAERWLLKHLHSDDLSFRPDTASYNTFLDLCSKGRALHDTRTKELVL